LNQFRRQSEVLKMSLHLSILSLSLLLVLNNFPKVSCYSHLEVEELFSDYFEWKMATHPQAATYAGYHLHSGDKGFLLMTSYCATTHLL
jgi:hypothetical protein